MPSLYNQLTDQAEALREERAGLMSQAEAASSFDGIRERLEEIDGALPTVEGDIARLDQERSRQRTAPAAAGAQEGPITPLGGYDGSAAVLSRQFLEDQEWTDYARRMAPSGQWGLKTRVEGPKIELQGSILPQRRGLVTGGGSTSAGALIIPDQSGIFDSALQRELTLLDVITRGTTDSDSVEYVRATSFTNNAAPVPEADSVDPEDTTGLKPQSALALLRVAETVKTIAHWEAITKRALSDAGQMRTILDDFLRYGLLEKLEDQIAGGDGEGENFEGILEVEGTQDQAFVTDIATTIRKAKTKVKTVGKARPNAVGLNPEDWEELDLFLTFEGGGTNNRQASSESPPRIWGLQIVESEAIPVGTAIVGDFRKAVLWDRQQTTVQASDGVNNFFLKNMVAVLAELRAAFGVIRPSAFVIADVGTGS